MTRCNPTTPLLALAIVLACTRTAAADRVAEEDGWRFSVMPYLWLPATIGGDVTLHGNSVVMRTNMVDLLERVELAGSLRAEAWQRGVGILVDALYSRLGDEKSTPIGELDLEISQLMIDLAAAYRFGRWSTSDTPDPVTIAVEIYGGARLSRYGTDLSPEMGPDIDSTEWFLDPIVGLRIPIQLSTKWQLAARGDIGGFGVDSDLLWNIVFGLDRSLSSTFAVHLGYRIMVVEFSQNVGMGDEVMMSTTTHGPAFAASARF
jgi:hypothetical protein